MYSLKLARALKFVRHSQLDLRDISLKYLTSSAQLSQSSEKLSLVSFKNKLNPAGNGSEKLG